MTMAVAEEAAVCCEQGAGSALPMSWVGVVEARMACLSLEAEEELALGLGVVEAGQRVRGSL
jgi:hypothetical protein